MADAEGVDKEPQGLEPSSVIASPGQTPEIVSPSELSDVGRGAGGGFLGVSIQQRGSNDALIAKMQSSHISQVIEIDKDDKKWRHIQDLTNSIIAIVGFVSFLLVVVALCVIFLVFNKPEFLQGILGLLIGLLSGGAGGYGIGRAQAGKPQKGQTSR
jgi:hypothetical protein